MAKFYLVRHGSFDALGNYLAGRMENLSLNALGVTQVEDLARSFRDVKIAFDRCYVSPVQRTRETAAILERELNLRAEVAEDFIELGFGAWTGRRFDELSEMDEWIRFRKQRSRHRPPGGETFLEVQARTSRALEKWNENSSGKNILVVTHADCVKATVCLYLGLSVDFLYRFEISPASVTILDLDGPFPLFHGINLPAAPRGVGPAIPPPK